MPSHHGASTQTGLLGIADQVLASVERMALWFAGLLTAVLMVLGVTEVISRSVFNSPVLGYIDVVGLITSAIAFLALAHCQSVGKHIRMELVVSALHGRAHWAAELLGALMALAVVTMLLDPTWQHAMRSKLLIPLALGLLWARLAVNALGYIRLVIWPDAEPVAVPRATRLIEDVIEETA